VTDDGRRTTDDRRDGENGGNGTPLSLRFTGAIANLSRDDQRGLFERSTSSDEAVRSATAAIVARVRGEGDTALRQLAREFDQVELEELEVSRDRWDDALERLAPDVRRAMERAARNIASVHRAFLPQAAETSPEPGIVVGRRPDPLGRVGVYAPGGRAAYPSSVLMGVIPARVAGVGEIVLCSPPDDATGLPSDVVLAAAAMADVDRVFALGGAGAIAAMAFGTESVPRVDRIVGPGNAYVAEAKLQVAGAVAIDAPAGPSEILVLADTTSRPEVVARELLAQAEHDPVACALVVVFPPGEPVSEAEVGEAETNEAAAHALRIAAALGDAIAAQPRHEVIRQALAGHGGILVATTPAEAMTFANLYAPEHLLLAARDVDALLPAVRNAGTVFVGESASNAFGDYMTGANHVLPTGSLARSYSGLSVLDFVRWTTYQRVTPEAAATLAEDVRVFAEAEGLPGHAMAAAAWKMDTEMAP